jgi:hypothetical protein
MRVGENGVIINVYAGGQPITGYTVQLKVVNPDNITTNTYTMTVNTDGVSADLTMASADFPVSGAYQIQLIATNGSIVLKSDVQILTITKSL